MNTLLLVLVLGGCQKRDDLNFDTNMSSVVGFDSPHPTIYGGEFTCSSDGRELVSSFSGSEHTARMVLNMWRTHGAPRHEQHTLQEHVNDGSSHDFDRRLLHSVNAHDQVTDVSTVFGCNVATDEVTGATTFMLRAYDADSEDVSCWIWSVEVDGVHAVQSAFEYPGDVVTDVDQMDGCREMFTFFP